ncbi:hypothetical protein [Acetobacter conturbans]|uniref:DUF3325 domain-containing protein n=1 Tax=Acetobacter conturbans TaxID=1737472 RepID=A0ABX0K074_9PROT|nr:hypothetical protein [Acetobacter conturbans]NHN89069.1 hypothetical protein [Acetobacter conturbans]
MIVLCSVLWIVSLSVQAVSEPRMLRIARREAVAPALTVRLMRWVSLVGLLLCLYQRPSTALFVWLGSFSIATVVVALGWAWRYRGVQRVRRTGGGS